MLNTSDKLTELARLRKDAESNRVQYERAREDAIPPDVLLLLEKIEVEYRFAADFFGEKIASLEDEIKSDVLTIGATVKGDGLMAVWNKGRVSWDSKTLDGYAVAHPEILVARKEGEPTVTIRATK